MKQTKKVVSDAIPNMIKVYSTAGVSVLFGSRNKQVVFHTLRCLRALYATSAEPLMLGVSINNAVVLGAEYIETGALLVRTLDPEGEVEETRLTGVNKQVLGLVLCEMLEAYLESGFLPAGFSLDRKVLGTHKIRFDMGSSLFYMVCHHPKDILSVMVRVNSQDGRKVSILVKSPTDTHQVYYYTDKQAISSSYYDLLL